MYKLKKIFNFFMNLMSKVNIPKDEKFKVNLNSIYHGHHKITYKGIKAIRCPFDYVIYQMIINEIKPDLIIEIGTNIGGGALYLADLLNNIGRGMVHTIDIIKQYDPIIENHPRIKIFTEGFENYSLENTKGFDKILIIEDGSHTYKDTLSALEKFAHLVNKDSYFIVEDGILNNLGLGKEYEGGPIRAIKEF
ncbi:MAG TPA: CmcI family methyltransferase, partial [Spirochaetota bacterium]|nr:CmcI family methyltransferase [Spirochaetota bacterium]